MRRNPRPTLVGAPRGERRCGRPSLAAGLWILGLGWVLAHPGALLAAKDRVFSIPLDDLKAWSERVVVPMTVKVTAHSQVHPRAKDCEMHFAAESDDYEGDPPGLVLEPMNLCVEPFFGKGTRRAPEKWMEFGDDATKDEAVQAEGVPRIWPEHLVGEAKPANPHHAIELHPLTALTVGGKTRHFSSLIFDPGYEGVQEATALRILSRTQVSVVNRGGMVEVTFNCPCSLGNFTVLDVKMVKSSVRNAQGGHRMNGRVARSDGKPIPVRLVSVAGSRFDDWITDLVKRKGASAELEALVLLALSPEALYEAAQRSHGNRVQVRHPMELIIYGEHSEDGEEPNEDE